MKRRSTFMSAVLGGMLGLAIYACARSVAALSPRALARAIWDETHAATR